MPIPKYSQIAVPYEELLAYERAGDDEYKVVIDRMPVKFSVAELLDGVDLPGYREGIQNVPPGAIFELVAVPRLFISYAHEDERFRDELRGALTPYERTKTLQIDDDTCILPGQRWEDELLSKVERADIMVLLLSNDFIRSDYCFQKEMQIARERDQAGDCTIVPIVVRACAYEKLELGELQAILPNGKPVKQNKDRDAAWLEVTKQLDKVIAEFDEEVNPDYSSE